jgi:sugar/nucleoside kinase (ribokinase family)
VRDKLQFDYATVGHVTVDELADGSRRPGGTAFYSALQAARLGLRTLVVTRGQPAEIEALLAPYGELSLHVEPAPSTTTLHTTGSGEARRQLMLAWAGRLAAPLEDLDAAIVHLAPVAAELPPAAELLAGAVRARFIGLTAQGLLRRWDGQGGAVTLAPPPPEIAAIASRCDALVLAEHEQASAEPLIAQAAAAGAPVLVTAGPQPTTIVLPDGGRLRQPVPPLPEARDDLGAGDVFAAALFVELARGVTPRPATDFANAAAAVRMSGRGAGAIGDRLAVEERAASAA